MIRTLLLTCILAATASAAPSESTLTKWLDETARLESSNRDSAVGDAGRSRGRYQIQKATWKAYSKAPWKTGAHDPVESRRVARLILIDCAKACRKHNMAVTFKNARYFYRHGGF